VPVRPAAALRDSVLCLPTDIHSLLVDKPSSSSSSSSSSSQSPLVTVHIFQELHVRVSIRPISLCGRRRRGGGFIHRVEEGEEECRLHSKNIVVVHIYIYIYIHTYI